jgi:preprotein translocase subunit YajC
MAARAFKELSAWERRRALVAATVRTIATTALVVAIYYLIPVGHRADAAAVVEVALGAITLAVVIAWQIRQIIGSNRPVVRAAESIAFSVPLFILLFATTYFLMARAQPAAFGTPLTRTGAMYFSTTVFTSVGFGDITAKTQTARVVVTVQMTLDLVFLGLVLRLIANAAKFGRQRHT